MAPWMVGDARKPDCDSTVGQFATPIATLWYSLGRQGSGLRELPLLSEHPSRLRIWGSGVRISSGAPLPNKRQNRRRGSAKVFRSATRQDRFGAADADFLVRNTNFVHEQPRVSLTQVRWPAVKLLPRSRTSPGAHAWRFRGTDARQRR